MLLDYLAHDPQVQLGFLLAAALVLLALIFKKAVEKTQKLGIADRENSRDHEENMWRAKQGVIEHKKGS